MFRIYEAKTKLLNKIKNIPREIKVILLFFLITRITLTIIGVTASSILAPLRTEENISIFHKHQFAKSLWLDIWGQWDTGWYLDIAEKGYSPKISSDPLCTNQANYGFFPLYPLLAKILGTIVGNYYLAGILLANFFLILACIFLYKLVCMEEGRDVALNTLKYLFVFPLYILCARLSKNRFFDEIAPVLFALFQGFLMAFWSNGSYILI